MNNYKKINLNDVLRSVPNAVCDELDCGYSVYCDYCGGFICDPVGELYGMPLSNAVPKCNCKEPANEIRR